MWAAANDASCTVWCFSTPVLGFSRDSVAHTNSSLTSLGEHVNSTTDAHGNSSTCTQVALLTICVLTPCAVDVTGTHADVLALDAQSLLTELMCLLLAAFAGMEGAARAAAGLDPAAAPDWSFSR